MLTCLEAVTGRRFDCEKSMDFARPRKKLPTGSGAENVRERGADDLVDLDTH